MVNRSLSSKIGHGGCSPFLSFLPSLWGGGANFHISHLWRSRPALRVFGFLLQFLPDLLTIVLTESVYHVCFRQTVSPYTEHRIIRPIPLLQIPIILFFRRKYKSRFHFWTPFRVTLEILSRRTQYIRAQWALFEAAIFADVVRLSCFYTFPLLSAPVSDGLVPTAMVLYFTIVWKRFSTSSCMETEMLPHRPKISWISNVFIICRNFLSRYLHFSQENLDWFPHLGICGILYLLMPNRTNIQIANVCYRMASISTVIL